jgi:hypothetical protein
LPYQATVYKVMIASPSDVVQERRVIREVIHEWNSIHAEDRGIVLMPIGWETHSSPSMGERAQEIINAQLLRDSDLLVAAFWTRLGSPTGKAPSGTVEEIKEHIAAGKPAMIYFSSAPVHPDSVDNEQYRALREFKAECRRRGLVEEYESISEFREKFARQLAQTVIRHFVTQEPNADAAAGGIAQRPGVPVLSEAARELLVEASQDAHGVVLRVETMGGSQVETNGRNLVEPGNARSAAKWRGAIDELQALGLLEDRTHRGELFNITDAGYRTADVLGG